MPRVSYTIKRSAGLFITKHKMLTNGVAEQETNLYLSLPIYVYEHECINIYAPLCRTE